MTSPRVELPNPGPAGEHPRDPFGPPGRGRRLPEGLGLALAAVFGAVIVLAGALVVRSLVSGSTTDVDALPAPAAGTAADSVAPGPGEAGGDRSGDGAGADSEAEEQEEGEGDTTDQDSEADAPSRAPVEGIECPAGVETVICDAAAFVEQTRGRPFQEFPTVEILDDAAFDAALLSEFEEYRADLELDGEILTALGLLSPETSLADAFRDALELGVVGFYDPATGRLVVRGVELNLYAQLVLVHELTHALDDQWFDLDREDFVDGDADYGFAAVVEGNASRVDSAWREQLGLADQARLAEQELGVLSAEDIRRYLALPAILRDLQLSPYLDGLAYVEELVRSEGEIAVDDAILHPPLTSEEILHPGRARSDDPEIGVAVPPAEGEVIDEGRLGELLIGLWLGRQAGAGWGGDRYVAWSGGGETCLAVDVAADSARDLDELEAAGANWAAQARDRRSVELVSSGEGDLVRLTGCG